MASDLPRSISHIAATTAHGDPIGIDLAHSPKRYLPGDLLLAVFSGCASA